MEDKFSKFASGIFIVGIVIALYLLINSIIHTSTNIVNPPPASQFMGPDAKK